MIFKRRIRNLSIWLHEISILARFSQPKSFPLIIKFVSSVKHWYEQLRVVRAYHATFRREGVSKAVEGKADVDDAELRQQRRMDADVCSCWLLRPCSHLPLCFVPPPSPQSPPWQAAARRPCWLRPCVVIDARCLPVKKTIDSPIFSQNTLCVGSLI